MRILSLTNCPLDPATGSGKTVLTYTNGLRLLGHGVEAVAPDQFEWMPRVRRARKFRQALGAWRFLRRRLASPDFDLVEFYGDEFWLAACWLQRQRRRPFIVAHSNGFEPLYHERTRAMGSGTSGVRGELRSLMTRVTHERFSRVAFRSADAFVGLCEIDRQHAIKLGLFTSDCTATIPPGLDEEYLGRPMGAGCAQRVAFTGSWIPRKGTDQLCRVMRNLMERNPALRLDVFGAAGVGDGVHSAFPAALQPRITVHPRLASADMAQGIAQAGVFFFPTQYEGFGMALAEAMACGCAPVTTPTGYGAELKHGAEGQICDFIDEVAMERSIGELLDNQDRRNSMAKMAQRKVQSLQWRKCIKDLETLYLGWLDAASRKPPTPTLPS